MIQASQPPAQEKHQPLTADFEIRALNSDAMRKIGDSVARAVVERKAIVVYGGKGSGKSVALEWSVTKFNADEARRIKQSKGARYSAQRILLIDSPRSKKAIDLYSVIHRAVTGADLETRNRSGVKSVPRICSDLAVEIASAGVTGLAFDEAEKMTSAGLLALRDLMSACENHGRASQPGTTIAPSGIGVVLVGSDEAVPAISAWNEAGQRLVSEVHIADLSPEKAAGLYGAYLPGLQKHIQELGSREWTRFLVHRVCGNQKLSMRLVDSHCRNYVRLYVKQNPDTTEVADVLFDESIFLDASEGVQTLGRARNMLSDS